MMSRITQITIQISSLELMWVIMMWIPTLVCTSFEELYTTTDCSPSGIFFSKDRREEVIEVEEDAEMAQIPGFDEGIKIMSQGQWMKGCPEGSEQSFLFQLYSKLTDETPQPCPQGCGATYIRSKSDFFGFFVRTRIVVLYNQLIRLPIQPDFTSYILHVRAIVRKKCPRCHSEFCTACDEPISAERTHRPGAASDDNVLFHCSNLQGVILGIGLGILEQQFIEDTGGDNDSNPGRTSKRRKTSPNEESFLHQGRGTRAKGGTGYAGDQKEDVGHSPSIVGYISILMFLLSRCRGRWKHWLLREPKMERLAIS